MNKYEFWDKFNVELEIEEQERKEKLEEVKEFRKKNFISESKQNEENIAKAKNEMELLQQKAAVEALKAKGGYGRNRKIKVN
jgi:hypothetical protein